MMHHTPSLRRGTWTDVDNSVWDPPSKVWSALAPSIPPCPGTETLGQKFTYTLIPGPPPHFSLNGTGVRIFGYAWIAAKTPAFPALLPIVDDSVPLTVVWALPQALNATCMPFSITAESLGPPPHKLLISWQKQDGVLQEAILTHVLQASDGQEPPGSQGTAAGRTPLAASSPPTAPAATPNPSTPAAQSASSVLLITAIVVPTTLVVAMALVGLVLYKRASDRNNHAKHVNPVMDPGHEMQQMAMRPLRQSMRVAASSTDLSSAGGTMPYREHLVLANPDAAAPMTGKQRAFAAFQQWSAPASQSVESGISLPVAAPSPDGDQVALVRTVTAQIPREPIDARPPSIQGGFSLPRYER